MFALAVGIGVGPTESQSADPIGRAIETVPIFDAHMHYKKEAWDDFPAATVIELMDKSGVAMALVSSSPDDGTIRLWQHAPARIVPEVRPYHGDYGASNWTGAPGMEAYLRTRMAKYPHRGIGEFHLHRVDPKDEPLLRAVARLAASHKALIHVHSDAAPVHMFFRFDPNLTVLWAHAGMTEPPETIGPMMDRYPRLLADTSYRESDILAGDGKIDPAWRRLIERHPGRFLVGSDTWINGQWEQYGELIAMNRQWLAAFPRAIAEKIAYRNAEKLFGRPVSRKLIGTR